jgi:hypothetical protein
LEDGLEGIVAYYMIYSMLGMETVVFAHQLLILVAQ